MPLRSTGCHKCRQRKIRCDERRPGCLRCATHNVECPGYKTEAGGVEFRDETNQTALRVNTVDHAASNIQTTKPKKLTKEEQTRKPAFRANSAPEAKNADSHDCPGSTPAKSSSLTKLQVQRVSSPTVNRQALWSKFMDLYHPHNIAPHEKGLWVSHLDYMSSLITMPSCPPALSSGLDALSLIQIGSIYNDRRLRHKAIQAYSKALRGLAILLSKPASVHDDTVLATATILSICEFYTEFRLQGQNWIGHQQGMQRLIEARGPESLMESQLAVHLYFQSTSSALALSLILRKQNPYLANKWRGMREQVALHDDYTESFRTGLPLPGLLEDHDNLDMTDPEALQNLDDLLRRCSELEREMDDCLVNLHVTTPATDGLWPTLVDMNTFHPFAELVSDRTMSRAFRFPTFMTAYLYSSHWMRMYMLRETIQSLHNKRMTLVPSWQPAAHQQVPEQELLCYILNQCRQIPFFIEHNNSAIGEMCCFFPLFVAEMYFRRHGHWRWVEWVHHITDRIFHKGMSMPFITDRGDVPVQRDGGRYEEQYGFNWIEWPTFSRTNDDVYDLLPHDRLWTISMMDPMTPPQD